MVHVLIVKIWLSLEAKEEKNNDVFTGCAHKRRLQTEVKHSEV